MPLVSHFQGKQWTESLSERECWSKKIMSKLLLVNLENVNLASVRDVWFQSARNFQVPVVLGNFKKCLTNVSLVVKLGDAKLKITARFNEVGSDI